MKFPFFARLIKKATQNRPGFAVTFHPNAVCCARMKMVGNKPRVENFSRQNTNEEKTALLSSSDFDRVRKAMGIGKEVVSAVLLPGEYQLLQVEAPNVPEAEIKSAVRWSIKDALNYKVDDATIDVLNIPSGGSNERRKSLYVVAASNDLLKRRSAMFKRAHLNIGVIDIPELAQRNIAALFEEPGRALALLAFDDQGGTLTFTGDGELYLARRIEIGINQLMDADEGMRNQYIERLEVELQRSLDHFDRQYSHIATKKLLIAAPAELRLDQILAQTLGLPAEMLDLSTVMDLQGFPELKKPEMQAYALHTLGAALRDQEWGA